MEIEVSFRLSIKVFEKLRKKGAEFKRKVGDKYLYHDGSGFNLVDKDSLPKNLEEDNKTISRSNKHTEKKRWTGGDNNRFSHIPEDEEDQLPERKRSSHRKGSEPSPDRRQRRRRVRSNVLEGESDAKVAKRAADNHYIMQDVLSDPSMVGADSETEAVAKVAAENPAWAKLSSLTDAYDIDVDSVSGDSDGAGSGDSDSSLAESASDAAHGDTGDVSTADSSDLGPSTAADHGLSSGGGGDSPGSSSSTAGGSIGSSTAGGSIGSGSSSGSGSSGSGGGDT